MEEYSERYATKQPWLTDTWDGSCINDVILGPSEDQNISPDENYLSQNKEVLDRRRGIYVSDVGADADYESNISLSDDGYENVLMDGERLLKTPLNEPFTSRMGEGPISKVRAEPCVSLFSSGYEPVATLGQYLIASSAVTAHTSTTVSGSGSQKTPRMSSRVEKSASLRKNEYDGKNRSKFSKEPVRHVGRNVSVRCVDNAVNNEPSFRRVVDGSGEHYGGARPKIKFQTSSVPYRWQESQPTFEGPGMVTSLSGNHNIGPNMLTNLSGNHGGPSMMTSWSGDHDTGPSRNVEYHEMPQPPYLRVPNPQTYDQIVPRNKFPQKPVVFPDKYDGSVSWPDYNAHFELCADLNMWTDKQKANYLAVSLRGSAQELLGDMSLDMRQDYKYLTETLCARFGSKGQNELFRTQLKSRLRKANETLPELAQSIRRLVCRAYPDANLSLREILSKDHFIDALSDSDMRLRLKQSRSATLDETVRLSIELEAFQIAENERKSKKYVRLSKPASEEVTQGQLLEKISKLEDELSSLRLERKGKVANKVVVIP